MVNYFILIPLVILPKKFDYQELWVDYLYQLKNNLSSLKCYAYSNWTFLQLQVLLIKLNWNLNFIYLYYLKDQMYQETLKFVGGLTFLKPLLFHYRFLNYYFTNLMLFNLYKFNICVFNSRHSNLPNQNENYDLNHYQISLFGLK